MREFLERKRPELISHEIKVHGNITINFEIKHKLGISFDLYVFTNYIEKCFKNSKASTYENIFEKTGFYSEEAIKLFNEALEKELIECTTGVSMYKPTNKWFAAFSPEEQEFDLFWEPVKFKVRGENKSVSWTGSKVDAKEKFIKARKAENFEYLMKQKLNYFKLIAHSDWRKIMGCSVFLNLDRKRYSEDWTKYEEVKNLPKEKETLKYTKEDVTNLFNE